MRRTLAASIFTLLLLAAASSQESRVRELAPGVFFWQGDRTKNQPANCGWIVFKDYVLVIDANYSWGAKEILPEIRKTTNKPIRFVFNTHYHGDHAYGGSLFTAEGASIVCSEDCAMESRTKGQASWDKNTATGEFSLKPYHLAHPTVTFPQKMVFDDGEHRVELTKVGPGHSKGDAVAYLPKEKLLFTGDLCTNWKFGNNTADADADIENWARVLETMAKWDVRSVVVGHGAIGGTDTLRGQASYLTDMLKQVRAGRRKGKTVEVLIKEIDLSKHQPWGGNAERNAASIRSMYGK
ncbi:MAG TPA: MBL fold metallo-hydrolase [Bryobacteraceae bacterium]|nr:MBL fold metallo-hydrolase [Bryobacteraceae bacterium]